MNKEKLKKLLEKENNDRINITYTKFRNCLCLFNNYSKCYINIKKKYKEFLKYEKIYGNENIKFNEEKSIDYNKESSLEFMYPYRYENNRNIFLIINSKNINSVNNCIYNNDIIYIIYNNKKYEHVNLQKRKKKKNKKKKKSSYNMQNDTYSSLTSYVSNEEEDVNPIYNSTIFETSNMNFCEREKKKKKRSKLSNKRNFIYSDDDSDNHYEYVFTHINSDLYFLSVSNDHIEKEKNLYIQNEKYINYNDVIFRRLKFKKTLFINLDSYNSWIIIKKSILLNEYWNCLNKNDSVDINDVLYDVINIYEKITNCYTRIYINDSFLLINNKTKEILGVQRIELDNNIINKNSTNLNKNDDLLNTCTGNEESNYYKLVLIKKMNIKHLFNNNTDINITFHFHNVCLTNYNKLDHNNSYLLIHNYNLNSDSQILLNLTLNKKIYAEHLINSNNSTPLNSNLIDTDLLNHEDYIYFNNYITQKISENYLNYSLYIKECLLIIDILYILNNSYGNLIYIKEFYKYNHENYYSYICNILKKNKNYDKKNKEESNSIYSLSSYGENSNASSNSSQTNSSSFLSDDESQENLSFDEKINFNELNNELIYIMPKYKLIFHPKIFSSKESNNSNIEITKEILKLGIYLRKIQKFIEINKRGQSCNFTFDIFCCCLYNINLHILNHINKIEENIRNIFNFTKINMNDKNDISLCLFDENRLSTCTDPEEKKIFFSINNLFHKNIQDFNLFFNIDIEKTEDISLYKIKISILPLIQIAKLLNKIINKIIIKKKINNSKYLIDLIYKLQEYLNVDDINKRVLLYLLKNVTTPLFDFIKNYIFYGKVKDTYKEFFIHENKHITPYYRQNHKFYHNNIYKYIFKKYIDLSTNYWGAKYIILNNKVPVFLKSICNYIFITGKYIDVLSACSKLLNLQNKNFFYLEDNSNNCTSDIYINNIAANNENRNNDYNYNKDSFNNCNQEFSLKYTNNNINNKKLEDEYYNSNYMQSNKTCYLIYDNDKKIYEDLIHNQHLYASKKMFELYIKKIDIKEKIKHHYFFFFLQISDYLKYFYILSHEHLEKLYNNKKNNILNKLKNYYDISIRSSVLYNLKYRKDYNIDVSDILSIIDNVNIIIDLKNFHLNNDHIHFKKDNSIYDEEQKQGHKREQGEEYYHNRETEEEDVREDQYNHSEEESKDDDEDEKESERECNKKLEGIKKQKENKNNYSKFNEFKNNNVEKYKGTKKKIISNIKNNMLNIQNVQANINVEIYKGLILSYHNIFPYNLIFNNITIFKYTLIFRVLNYCKYIEHKLTEVWLNHMFVKNIDINEECKNNLMICIHTRESMLHFLKCYLYHIQNDVIKSEYYCMNNKFKETLIFDDIIHIHNNYLNNILKYSFIMNTNIINCILKLISIAHIFTRHILKFSFDKNEQIEKLSHENQSCNSLNRNVVNNKKNNKNNYHKKFIQELLRDKAYISMIHNTIKHYDKHFKIFFLLLTEYVNNNIDDYAHNFLIKLDYNFYYTNKYKIPLHINSVNECNSEYKNENFSNYIDNSNTNSFESNNANNKRKKKFNNANDNGTNFNDKTNYYVEANDSLSYINSFNNNQINYNLHNFNNNNNIKISCDIKKINTSINFDQKESFKNNTDINNNYYSNSTSIPNNYINETNDKKIYNPISLHKNDLKNQLINKGNINESNFIPFNQKNNQNIPFNCNSYDAETVKYDNKLSKIPHNINYSKLQKYNLYNVNNENISNINLSNIDINSISSSTYNNKFNS
ncbi:spindle pole body protein, putative [Plasmodium relictum]|uniref:Spindle pole body protein, putative n=1 Tax=Plasmodium relictum TaxID=85471 RepID=A0A1J1H4P2_PLARL|nr:spindle pole body protein, putative [Plasmodium relictum]CRG99892.1 spindle pole body protein, putative [Plasmodium relictum]